MASKSLIQLKDEITAFALSHGQLNDVCFCPADQWFDRPDHEYPCLFFYYTGARRGSNQLFMNFSAYIADRVIDTGVEQDNEAEVLSDTMLIGCDLLSYLDGQDDYILDNNTPITPFNDTAPDVLAGSRFDFTLRTAYPADRCVIPYKVTNDAFTYTLPFALS